MRIYLFGLLLYVNLYIMKKNEWLFLPMFIIILLLFSCKSRDNELVVVKSCDFFTETSFDTVIHMKHHIFNDSVICNPVRLSLQDSILFSIDATYSSDTLVRCFSILSGRYLGPIFMKGNGPKEVLSVSSIEFSVDSTKFWTFDVTKQNWFGRKLESLNKYLSIDENDYTILSLKNIELLGLDQPHWIKNGFVATSLFKHKERFFVYTTDHKLKKTVINPNLYIKEGIFADNVLGDIFSTRLCTTPDFTKIILAGRYLDLIEIYDVDGNIKKMLKGPKKEFDLDFDKQKSIGRSAFVKNMNTRRAYLAVKATSDNIYALYSGKSKKDKENYSYSKSMYVFSLDGSCLYKYILDIPIIDFVVDEQNGRIYATSIDADIVYFDINIKGV